MTNPVIINADDFGYSPSVNTAIVALAEKGILQATSYMAYGEVSPSDRASILARRDQGLFQVGLHLDFTSHLIPNGFFKQALKPLIIRSFFRRLDQSQIQTSIMAQFDRFEQTWGFLPEFIDGHEHIHQFAQIRQALLDECEKRYAKSSLPLIRSTKPFAGTRSLKPHIIYFLGGRAMRCLARRRQFPLNNGFGGSYDFHANEIELKKLWETWLTQAKKEGGIIMCHPALSCQNETHDPIAQARLREFNFLQSRP